MKQLNTPFGTMYVTEWDKRNNNLYPECESEGRITVYDSKIDYFDYFTEDYFFCDYDKDSGLTEEEWARKNYDGFCEMIESGCDASTLEEFLDWFGINYDYAGPDKEKAAEALSHGDPSWLLPNELEENEYVNHIGENYIVVSDYI